MNTPQGPITCGRCGHNRFNLDKQRDRLSITCARCKQWAGSMPIPKPANTPNGLFSGLLMVKHRWPRFHEAQTRKCTEPKEQ